MEGEKSNENTKKPPMEWGTNGRNAAGEKAKDFKRNTKN